MQSANRTTCKLPFAKETSEIPEFKHMFTALNIFTARADFHVLAYPYPKQDKMFK